MNSKKKQVIAPIIVTILMVLYYVVYFGFLITLLDGIWKYALGIIPLAFSIVMWRCVRNRSPCGCPSATGRPFHCPDTRA